MIGLWCVVEAVVHADAPSVSVTVGIASSSGEDLEGAANVGGCGGVDAGELAHSFCGDVVVAVVVLW